MQTWDCYEVEGVVHIQEKKISQTQKHLGLGEIIYFHIICSFIPVTNVLRLCEVSDKDGFGSIHSISLHTISTCVLLWTHAEVYAYLQVQVAAFSVARRQKFWGSCLADCNPDCFSLNSLVSLGRQACPVPTSPCNQNPKSSDTCKGCIIFPFPPLLKTPKHKLSSAACNR